MAEEYGAKENPMKNFSELQSPVRCIRSVWSNTTESVSLNGLTNVVQQTLVTTNRFFRLRRP